MMDMLITALVVANWTLGLYLLLRSGGFESAAILKVSVPTSAPLITLRRRPLRLAAAA